MVGRLYSENTPSLYQTVVDIGYSVENHRKRVGYTQQQLAELTGRSRAYIIGVENGSLHDIPLSFIYDLADIFKCKISDFLPERRVTMIVPPCRGAAVGREELYALIQMMEEYRPDVHGDEWRAWGMDFPAAEYKTLAPQTAAQKLRTEFGLSVPVDMDVVFERAGVLPVSLPLSDGISTILDMRASVPVVFIDSVLAEDHAKRRAALAHALGHCIAEYGFKGIYVDKKESIVLSENILNDQDAASERKARAFATALLLPQDSFKERLADEAKKTGGNDEHALASLAAAFGVTVLAVIGAIALLHSGDGKK